MYSVHTHLVTFHTKACPRSACAAAGVGAVRHLYSASPLLGGHCTLVRGSDPRAARENETQSQRLRRGIILYTENERLPKALHLNYFNHFLSARINSWGISWLTCIGKHRHV